MLVKKILVAIDFSPTSARALDCARTLADALGAHLDLVHVLAEPLDSTTNVRLKQQDACARLAQLLTADDRVKRHAAVSCQVGTPVHELASFAGREAIDLLILGGHTQQPAFRMATGSIAESLIGLAPCAVLTVKTPEEEVRAKVA